MGPRNQYRESLSHQSVLPITLMALSQLWNDHETKDDSVVNKVLAESITSFSSFWSSQTNSESSRIPANRFSETFVRNQCKSIVSRMKDTNVIGLPGRGEEQRNPDGPRWIHVHSDNADERKTEGRILSRERCSACNAETNEGSKVVEPFQVLSLFIPNQDKMSVSCTVIPRVPTSRFWEEGQNIQACQQKRYSLDIPLLDGVATMKEEIAALSGIPAESLHVATKKRAEESNILTEIRAHSLSKARSTAVERVSALLDEISTRKKATCLECPVCFGPMDEAHGFELTPCGHSYCSECLQNILVSGSTTDPSGRCPHCRNRICRSEVTSLVTLLHDRPTHQSHNHIVLQEDDSKPCASLLLPNKGNTVTDLQIIESSLRLVGPTGRTFDPTATARTVSLALWPSKRNIKKNRLTCPLGLRLDCKDRLGHWYSGSIIKVRNGETSSEDENKFKVHFDNFSPKWDEWFSFDAFREGNVKPLYTRTSPKPTPIRIEAFHRYTGQSKEQVVFGEPFVIELYREWSTARAVAHILIQLARFLPVPRAPSDQNALKLSQLWDLSERIVEFDTRFIGSLLLGDTRTLSGLLSTNPEEPLTSEIIQSVTMLFEGTIGSQIAQLPFEIRVSAWPRKEEVMKEWPFLLSMLHAVGNSLHAQNYLIIEWKNRPKSTTTHQSHNLLSSLSYTEPSVVDAAGSSSPSEHANKEETLINCFTESFKLQASPSHSCRICGNRQEKELFLWELPELLVVRIKTLITAPKWRKTLTTMVHFPLVDLDVRQWCHPESPALATVGGSRPISTVYDLVGVMNKENAPDSTSPFFGTFKMGDLWFQSKEGSGGNDAAASNEIEPIDTSRVVTEEAHVLFYQRRRQLSIETRVPKDVKGTKKIARQSAYEEFRYRKFRKSWRHY